MASQLTREEKENYTEIIDQILGSVDLQTVTRKKIRQGLEAAVNKDLSDKKDAIKSLIEARFDAISSMGEASAIPTPPSATANGHTGFDDPDADEEHDTEVDGEIKVSLPVPEEHGGSQPPARKKQKRESSTEDADARLAAELQAQENRLAHARTTRGGGASKPSKKGNSAKAKAKAPRKKSEKRARDDSDGESGSESGAGKEKRKAGGGFQKPFALSPALAELCGEAQLSRPQVVKKLWNHIKANNLQDPENKRQIQCDEKMQAVFRVNRLDMFQMNKLLGNYLYPPEEV